MRTTQQHDSASSADAQTLPHIVPMWLTARQAASLVLGVSLRHFRDLAKRADFPAAKPLGAHALRWSQSQLVEWIERREDFRPGGESAEQVARRHRSGEVVLAPKRQLERAPKRRKTPAAARNDEPAELAERRAAAPEPAELAQRRADADAGREVLPAPFSNH